MLEIPILNRTPFIGDTCHINPDYYTDLHVNSLYSFNKHYILVVKVKRCSETNDSDVNRIKPPSPPDKGRSDPERYLRETETKSIRCVMSLSFPNC